MTGTLANPKKKQVTLFSFFQAKKPGKEAVVSTNKKDEVSPKANIAAAKKSNPDVEKVEVGTRVEVFWPDDEKYYKALVKQKRTAPDNKVFLQYEIDNQCEWLDLNGEKFRILDEGGDDEQPNKKRRRIQDDDDESDEEMEFEMDDESESEASAYVDDPKADEDEEEEDISNWIVDDDEDDEEVVERVSKKKKKTAAKKQRKATMRVTKHTCTTMAVRTPESGGLPKNVTPSLSQYGAPKQLSAPVATFTPTRQFGKASATPQSSRSAPPANNLSYSDNSSKPPDYVKGELNAAGKHVHNHLAFLQNPRDISGHPQDHPDYDARTLKIDKKELAVHQKMTGAVEQWWDTKARYFDTVLLFKTGKFYEMFHMDADVGVQVCGFSYMKGHVAHAGFPEISYGVFADKLVRAGYKVARCEQTETPAMLKERKKKYRSGQKPQVVNREVCSVLTAGTRTFCFLDDQKSLLEEASENNNGGGIGPLLAIQELLQEDTAAGTAGQQNDADSVQPVCEYGITLIDAARGSVTIGQFADDVLRSRMNTLLTTSAPSEVLLEGGENGASPTLQSLIRSVSTTSGRAIRIEKVLPVESFPKSTAVNPAIRRMMERETCKIQPWDVKETLHELHRRRYYPSASKEKDDKFSVSRWPTVLKSAVEGNADLAMSSFGAALFYLQRSMVDSEILSMGIVKAYIPPASSTASMSQAGAKLSLEESAPEETDQPAPMEFTQTESLNTEDEVKSMSLDGTTLHNLEILTNSVDHKVVGSLWSKINFTKTPHGSRLLRAWLLRPLFKTAEINRRADAVQELVSGGAAVALSEATSVLAKCGDIERLLSRIHSMSGSTGSGEENEKYHPSERAILYENDTYNKRKLKDFSKVLTGLRHVTQIPEIFSNIDIQSGLLKKIVRLEGEGGRFPAMSEELDWFFDNFDFNRAAKGQFEPSEGVDEIFDQACERVRRIKAGLDTYKDGMCSNELSPRHVARASWKYINTKPDSKDKYLIELPASVSVPENFFMKGKRGSGTKQVNKYSTPEVEELVQDLESAYDVLAERRALGLELFFRKFDSMRNLWAAAAQATSMLDALGSLAQTSSKMGYTRPRILECPLDASPSIRVIKGRHPCVDNSIGSPEFIPNDLSLGSDSRVLLLSGPNMGGKSTLLRQTCLITILAQIGCYVPAEDCELTPVDCIYTRLGASDRLLLGQSTFFVELAETAAALRGATRRSLVIMDELGRGTSTFDGTAIASATVQHLVERSKCVSLFATHYHSLLDEWDNTPNVRLGHMECIVSGETEENNITFLYTLGDGVCPKSFGINVARLAGLPDEVLSNAKRISTEFENEMITGDGSQSEIVLKDHNAVAIKHRINELADAGDWNELQKLWKQLQD